MKAKTEQTIWDRWNSARFRLDEAYDALEEARIISRNGGDADVYMEKLAFDEAYEAFMAVLDEIEYSED